MPLTPGAYLKHRRQAAGLSVADVAALMRTEPHEPEHLRIERLKLIEADAAPMTLATIVGLRLIYRFDLTILAQLEAIAQGASDINLPPLCRFCACSQDDACSDALGQGCDWVSDDVCSRCAPAPESVAA